MLVLILVECVVSVQVSTKGVFIWTMLYCGGLVIGVDGVKAAVIFVKLDDLVCCEKLHELSGNAQMLTLMPSVLVLF